MLDPTTFRDLLGRTQRGDQAAAFELVREYEPLVLRAARAQLLGVRLGTALEASDVSQTVFFRFFVRLAQGGLALAEPADLLNLLHVMTRNHVLDEVRKRKTQRRNRRQEPQPARDEPDVLEAVAAPGGTPSSIVASHELIAEIRRRLTPEEQHLLDRRSDGCSWEALGAELEVRADTLRKKLDRALTRVLRELGLDSSIDLRNPKGDGGKK
jgi:RNA polymerase sigma factor (sigma-70 family)